MKKVKTLLDIEKDKRVERVIKDYDGKGKHMVEFKDGFKLNGETSIDIGNTKDLCYGVNEQLEKTT